jgi:Domain of unknown function (DUF4386)
MSPNVSVANPGRTMARVTGGLYLAFILASFLADVFGHTGISDVDLTYQTLTNDPEQFALGLVFALASALLFVLAAWGLYVILEPVNRNLALLFLVLNAIGVAIQVASYVPLILAMHSADASSFTDAFSPTEVEGLQRLFIDVYKSSFVMAQLFFGAWLFPLGYLVYCSGFLPRVLGALLVLDGVAVFFWLIQEFLLPEHSALAYPGLVVSFVAEVGLALWLLVRGIDTAAEPPGLPD